MLVLAAVADLETRLARAMARAVALGEVGVQVAVYLRGELVADASTGVADVSTGRAVDCETLFPVFSVTKAITAIAIHIQAERGLVNYDRPIADYWPEYGANGKDRTTVRDLLMHRTGAPQMPDGITLERLAEWDWMAGRLAAEVPIFPPATTNAYHSLSWGWLVGEIVRRSDGCKRSFGRYVQEEICEPLGIDSLFVGLPPAQNYRVATLIDDLGPPASADGPASLRLRTMPAPVAPVPAVFNRPDVWAAENPGAGGIMNARSAARAFAMLAHGGELDGVRLLSEERLRSLLEPRPHSGQPDRTSGVPRWVGVGGFWLGGQAPPADPMYGPSRAVLGHPGAGGSNGWADLDADLAVAILHNRMFDSDTIPPDRHPFMPIAEEIRSIGRELGRRDR